MAMRALQLVGRVAVGVVLGVVWGVVLVGVSLVGTRKILSQLCRASLSPEQWGQMGWQREFCTL